MKAMTYDNWRAAGYYVRAGEKATGRDKTGAPAFTRSQVEDAGERSYPDENIAHPDRLEE